MPRSTTHDKQDALRKQLEGIAKSFSRASPALSDAVRSVLAPLEYADETLLKSHLNSAAEALRDFVQDTIVNQLQEADSLKEVLREAWNEYCTGICTENLDHLGKEIESLIDKQLEALRSLHDGPVKALMEEEYSIENAPDLEQGIKNLQKLKEEIFRDWPWSGKPLPPVNRQMVAKSRAAIARGEKGERIEDLIKRLGGDTSSKGD